MASSTSYASTKECHKGDEIRKETEQAAVETFGKVKEAGAHILESAKDTVGSVGDMAVETAAAVGRKADDLTAACGHEIKEFGDTVGKKAPHDGVTGHASQAVADTIKGSGKYIEEAKLSGMAHDVEQTIKNHPLPALLICFGVGFCVGRALRD